MNISRLALALIGAGLLCAQSPFSTNFIPRVIVKHVEADGVGYNGGYSTAEGMFAFQVGQNHVPFIDARWHVLDRGKMAVNIGGGYRYDVAGSGVLIGGNAYYDQRGTTGGSFQQVSGGIEVLSPYIDFRGNGYFPIGDAKEIRSARFAGFQGHSLMVDVKERLALTGCDGELGSYLGQAGWAKFYAAAGGYFFKRQTCNTHFGFMGRLRASWNDNVWAQVSVTNDDLYHTNVQGTLAVNIPFWSQKARTTPIQGRNFFPNRDAYLAQPVIMQELIVLCDTNRLVPASSAEGQELVFIFVDNTSNSDGTIEDPYPLLIEAQAVSKPGDIICVFPGDGTDKGCREGIVLKPGQQLLGSGKEHTIITSMGPVTLPARTSERPKITNVLGPCVTLADNTVVSSFDIEQPLGCGIFASNISNTLIDNVSIIKSDAPGIAIHASGPGNTSNVRIHNSSVSNSQNTGLYGCATDTAKLDIKVSGCTFESSASSAVVLVGSGRSILNGTISHNLIQSPGKHGISVVADDDAFCKVEIAENQINKVGAQGLHLEARSATNLSCKMEGNSVIEPLERGLFVNVIDSAAMDMSIDSMVIDRPFFDGLDINVSELGKLDVQFRNNQFLNCGANGMVIYANGDSSLFVKGMDNTLSGIGQDAIDLFIEDSATVKAIFDQNTFSDIINYGLDIENENSSDLDVTITNTTMQNIGRFGIELRTENTAAIKVLIDSNIIDGSKYNGIDIDVYTQSSIDIDITNNTVSNSVNSGIDIYGSGNNATATINVSGNTIENNLIGLFVRGFGQRAYDVTIDNNMIRNNIYYGLYTYANSGTGITSQITNNTIMGHRYYGMLCYAGGLAAQSTTLRGNNFSDNGYYGLYLNYFNSNNAYYGLHLSHFNRGSDNQITVDGNTFNNNRYYGFVGLLNGTLDTQCTVTSNIAQGNNLYGIFLRSWSGSNATLKLEDNVSSTGYSIQRYNNAVLNCITPPPPSQASLEAANTGTPFIVSPGINYILDPSNQDVVD